MLSLLKMAGSEEKDRSAVVCFYASNANCKNPALNLPFSQFTSFLHEDRNIHELT